MNARSRQETGAGQGRPASARTHWSGPQGGLAGRSARQAVGLLSFNAVSALGGGLALMTGLIPEQASWIRHTDFPSLFLPGVILFAVVGGTSAVAAIALTRGLVGGELAGILAGVVMVVWIVGEIASIRGFHVLQVVYLATGVAVLWRTQAPRTEQR